MFDHTSRYYALDTATLTATDGRVIAYVRRRFLPDSASLQTLTQVTVVQGDRLDLITARTLGVPEQFWQLCDANDAMNPPNLTATIGRVLRIPVPQPPAG